MIIKELWRYPVKSLAGEMLQQARLSEFGVEGDRRVVVVRPSGRVMTARSHPRLLSLKGSTGPDGEPQINGKPWSDAEALALVREAAGEAVELVKVQGTESFDVLPLSVATDGAVAYLGVDRRRFRPNIFLGGVEGLAERAWQGRALHIGNVVVRLVQLRSRCVMTTWDPDTQVQDPSVLRRIVEELDGRLSLDSAVERGGVIRVGDEVELVPR
jgi:uncharacterized protein YcbX